MDYYYNPYDGQFYYMVRPVTPSGGTPYQLPAGEGNKWIGKNVDIIMTNGTRYCNVRFTGVENPGGGFVWVFDDYSQGSPPITRRISNMDVAEINQAGTLCRPTSTPSSTGKPWYCYTWWGSSRPECK